MKLLCPSQAAIKITATFFCFSALLNSTLVAVAADTNTPPAAGSVTNPPPKVHHWESVAAAALALTSGNSKSFLGTASIDSKGKYQNNEYLLGGGAGYGETTTTDSTGKQVTTKTQDYLKGYAQWNHLFSERFYAGLKLDALHDDISDVQYRFTASPLAGYYFIKKPQTSLAGEVGPSYVYQKLDDNSAQSYLGARVAERWEYKFKGGSRLWESVEWITQVDKVDNWILTAEAGASAPVTKALDLRLVVQDWYNNQPAPNRLKNDLKLLAGIGYKF